MISPVSPRNADGEGVDPYFATFSKIPDGCYWHWACSRLYVGIFSALRHFVGILAHKTGIFAALVKSALVQYYCSIVRVPVLRYRYAAPSPSAGEVHLKISGDPTCHVRIFPPRLLPKRRQLPCGHRTTPTPFYQHHATTVASPPN